MSPNVSPCDATRAAPAGPQMNALKHGMRAASVLLPNDDAAEFQQKLRIALVTYQPKTPDEVDCVELLVTRAWEMARCRRWRSRYGAKLDSLLYDASGDVGRDIEPETHYWQHRGMDCTLEENRLERQLHRAWKRLLELQDLRRKGLVVLPAPQAVLEQPAAQPVLEQPAAQSLPERPVPEQQATAALEQTPTPAAPASSDGEIGKIRERNSGAPPAELPGGVGVHRPYFRSTFPAATRPAGPVPSLGAPCSDVGSNWGGGIH